MKRIFSIIKNHAIVWRDFFIDLIFPIECLGCGREKVWLCPECQEKIKFNHQDTCPACHSITYHGQFCPFCEDNYSLEGIFVATDFHDKLINKAVKVLKYNFVTDLGNILGDLLSQYLAKKIEIIKIEKREKHSDGIINFHRPQKLFSDFQNVLIIPIPLHPRRERWRGFNQSKLIAEQLARNLEIEIDTKNLKRIRHRPPQAKLNKQEREKNILGCFAWQGEKISQKIILIDDLSTTSSTLNEAAKVLKANGAPEVWGLVVARN